MTSTRPRIILDSEKLSLTINRLSNQLIENHADFSNAVIIGVQPRGTFLADRIYDVLSKSIKKNTILKGSLDVAFYRDDFRRREKIIAPESTDIEFSIEGKNVVLVDDVLYTGRTIRAALDALLAFGRPAKVELLVLIDRRFSRQIPVQADYVGKTIDTITTELVKVEWQEQDGKDAVSILSSKDKNKT